MTLTRWHKPDNWNLSPFRRMSTLRDEIDQLFDRLVTSPLEATRGTQFLSGWLPPVDLVEDKDNFVVKAELPGLKKDEIEISLHDGFLTLSGERKAEKKEDTSEVYRTERYMGRFQRTISLPTRVVAEKIKATYTNGVLSVTLPKAEDAKPKQIPVEVK